MRPVFSQRLASLFLVAILGSSKTLASAPMDQLTVTKETVLDMKTGLTWQRQASSKAYGWLDAQRYCNGLELSGSGWRLPTLKELHTLVDETRVHPAIDIDVFPDGADWSLWTSSPLVNFSSTYAWAVGFTYGFDAWFELDTLQKVRCVR